MKIVFKFTEYSHILRNFLDMALFQIASVHLSDYYVEYLHPSLICFHNKVGFKSLSLGSDLRFV